MLAKKHKQTQKADTFIVTFVLPKKHGPLCCGSAGFFVWLDDCIDISETLGKWVKVWMCAHMQKAKAV